MNHETTTVILFVENKQPLDDKKWEGLLRQLPPFLHQQVLKFKRWQDRQASLFGKLLLKKGLISINHPPHLLQTIRLDAYKRPEMDGDIDFNISHTEGLVVCAIQKSSRLGIDIERVRPINLPDFKSVFTTAELDLIANNTDPSAAFFDSWTRKEAVMKADGRGFHLDPSTFEVINDQVQLGPDLWFTKKIPIIVGYCCHLAQSVDRPVMVKSLSVTEMIELP